MKYCNNCGTSMDDRCGTCPNCGVQQTTVNYNRPNEQDSDHFGWMCLGFCVPIVGLILFLVWKDQYPMKAKKLGKGALGWAIAFIAFWILYFVIVVFVLGLTMVGLSSAEAATIAATTVPIL